MSDHCEWPEFFNFSYPVARKNHKCCECSAPILKGEKHGYFCGKWDNKFQSFRQHTTCEQACVFIRDNFHGGECIGFGSLKEHYGEFTDGTLYNYKDDSRAFTRKQFEFRNIMAKIKWRERPHSLPWRKERHRRKWCLRNGIDWKTNPSARP